jgi:predicted PurR-regulated permease PerM
MNPSRITTSARRNLFSSMFSLAIIASALFVTQRFLLPLLWAVILCIATWPLYLRMLQACRGRNVAAAAAATVVSALVFVTPLVLGVVQAAHQAPALAALVADANNAGIGAPQWLLKIPMAGSALYDWWAATLGQPHGLAHLLHDGSIARLHSASDVLRTVGANALHRMIDVGFAFMALFFFYKDGLVLRCQVGAIGNHLIGTARWELYSTKIPTAVRATVNGLVLVGLAEGVLLGIAYEMAGVPSAVLWAAATGILAIIPFGAPLAFGAVALVLLMKGSTVAALAILAWGTAVLFVADHFVRPTIIGNATALPFLAVLLGILGGVETLGLIGLFVGPVVMTLFVTLWHEEKLFGRERE